MNDIEWDLITSCNCICQEVIFMFTSLSLSLSLHNQWKGKISFANEAWSKWRGSCGGWACPSRPTHRFHEAQHPLLPLSFQPCPNRFAKRGRGPPMRTICESKWHNCTHHCVGHVGHWALYVTNYPYTIFSSEKCIYNVGILALERANMFQRMTCKFHLTILVPLSCML